VAERIHGPYKHRNKYRIIGVRADGSRIRESFATYEEAAEAKAQALAALGVRSLGQAVNLYLDHLRSKGRRASTLKTSRARLVAFLRLTESDTAVSDLTPDKAERLYRARISDGVKPDTHQNELSLARALCGFLVKTRWMASNPFQDVEPAGARNLGRDKDQLRLGEARRLLGACLEEASPEATAVAVCLLTGARASEVTDRVCRDVDAEGTLLWITRAKTGAGNRPLTVADPVIASRLATLTRDRGPQDPLWGLSPRDKEPHDRHWLRYHVTRLSQKAGVPDVGPHGLRRSFATLARVSGTAAETVARELGQTSQAVTQRSYYAPGTEGSVHARTLGERLTLDSVPRSPDPPSDSV
jgi:integrase